MVLIALTIVASLKAVGVIVLALLITPGNRLLLVKRLNQMMILGAMIGIAASISGMYISYFQPSGPAIV